MFDSPAQKSVQAHPMDYVMECRLALARTGQYRGVGVGVGVGFGFGFGVRFCVSRNASTSARHEPCAAPKTLRTPDGVGC